MKKPTYGLFSVPSDEDKKNFVPNDGHDMKPTAKSNIDIVQKKVKPTAKSNNPINHKKGTDEGFIDLSEEDKNNSFPDKLLDEGNDMKPNAKSNIEIVQKKVKPSAKINNQIFLRKGKDEVFSDPSYKYKKTFLPNEGNDMKLSDNSYIEIGPEKLKDEAFTHSTSVIVKNSTKPTKRCELNKITKGTTKDNNTCNRKKQ